LLHNTKSTIRLVGISVFTLTEFYVSKIAAIIVRIMQRKWLTDYQREKERERERERELNSHKCRQNQKGKRPSMLVPMTVAM